MTFTLCCLMTLNLRLLLSSSGCVVPGGRDPAQRTSSNRRDLSGSSNALVAVPEIQIRFGYNIFVIFGGHKSILLGH